MTATAVNGISVVSDSPARAPISVPRTGAPVYWEQIRELTFADGSTIYGCIHCEYVNTNRNSMRPHLNAHRPRKPKTKAAEKVLLEAQERTIAVLSKELDKALAKVDRVTAREKAAQAEARRARRELETLRGILAPSLQS